MAERTGLSIRDISTGLCHALAESRGETPPFAQPDLLGRGEANAVYRLTTSARNRAMRLSGDFWTQRREKGQWDVRYDTEHTAKILEQVEYMALNPRQWSGALTARRTGLTAPVIERAGEMLLGKPGK